MTHCPFESSVQDYLDGMMPAVESQRFGDHLESCASCAAEMALYGRLFERLDAMPMAEPPPQLAERVLAGVLRSRNQLRWVRTLGWGYAASVAASVAGVVTLLSFSASRAWLMSFANDMSQALIQSAQTVLNLVGFALVQLASGWGLLNAIGERFAPITRAMATLLSQPGMAAVLWMSVLFCAGLLVWMRRAGSRSNKGIRHVGLLGF